MNEDEPYALAQAVEKERRLGLLNQARMKPLAEFVSRMRLENANKYIPHFDSCDGGVMARVLFLLEAPGPQTMKSGFVSCNNPDQTARNMNALITNAGIQRHDILLWNIVPWYVGDGKRIRPVNNDDLRESLPYTKQLLASLFHLQLIVLVGKKAQAATSVLRQVTSLPFVATYHPSPQVFNISPDKKQQTQEAFSSIGAWLQKEDIEYSNSEQSALT